MIRKTGQYKGIYDCVKNIFETNGVKGFYRGYIPNVLGIIPYAGIDLAIYEVSVVYPERNEWISNVQKLNNYANVFPTESDESDVLLIFGCGTLMFTKEPGLIGYAHPLKYQMITD